MPAAFVGRGLAVHSFVHRPRADELLSVPGLLSLARGPLAAAFPFAMTSPPAALAVVAAAGITDVLDGWFARHSGRVTETGAVLDPLMDKLFVVTVVVSLTIVRRLSIGAALLLGARDVIEVPLILWLSTRRARLSSEERDVKANRFGKAATALQFATVVAALLAPRYALPLAVASGVNGVIAGASYWARALGYGRRARGKRRAGV
jgi:CDP-diacylglycerol--glycerol-3-phosphate 3-phosphatidyltransferase/cardiolipin synthase